MTSQGKHAPSSTVTCRDHATELVAANRVVADVRNRWHRGETPDLVALLAENPELRDSRSVFLDLAREEFCRRVDAGEPLDTDEFCRRFPSFQHSLCMLIEVGRLLDHDPRFQPLLEQPAWPNPGESFLGYSLVAEIGRGSFARVFLASEPALGGRPVVLKVAPHGGGEAEVAGRLQHPNIVPVHSVNEDPASGLTAICMPYLGRATLCDVLDLAFAQGAAPTRATLIAEAIRGLRGDADPEETSRFDRMLCRGDYVESVLHLVAQIADALAYTHARGICHRDLKPSNVLLSVEGRPLLLDFNLSVDGKTNAWRIGGTLPYMAPEQLQSVVQRTDGRMPPSDPRSDLFSLGVIAHQLLSGELPFGQVPQGESVEEVAVRFLDRHGEGPRSLRKRNKRVDRPVEELVAKCLAFDPDDRPQSAGDLADAVRRQLAPVRRARRWTRNHPRPVLAGAAVLLMLVAAGGFFLASRAPYSVRQYRQGLRYAQQGQYRLAARCLDKSIETEQAGPEVLFARGRVRQKLGLYDVAKIDFYEAWKIAPRAELNACAGFCATKLDNYRLAQSYYGDALKSGFRSPGLLNDLGHMCMQLNNLAEAERYLTEALDLAPDFQAAHNNVLLLHVRRVVSGEPATESMLEHARRTLQTAPPSGELYYLAATLFARAGKQEARWVESAKEYLRLAVANRWDTDVIACDAGLAYLWQDPRVRALCRPPAVAAQPVRAVMIVDPLEGCPGVESFTLPSK